MGAVLLRDSQRSKYLQRHSQLEMNERSDTVSSSFLDERHSQLVPFSSDAVS